MASEVAGAVEPRRLDARDCELVAALIHRAFAGLGVDPPPSALRVTGAAIQAHLDAGGGGAVIDPSRACLLWTVAGDGLALSRLAVDPAYRRRGFAGALLAAAAREARQRGLARLQASTRLALPGNLLLFTRYGFAETGRTAHPGFAMPTSVDLECPVTELGRP